VGDVGDNALVTRIIRDHKVNAIIHFAGSLIVPESMTDPLLYYENNTCKTRSLIADAVREGVPHFIFSSTAAVYGTAGVEPVREDARTAPESPYGASKLMTEWILRDTAAAHKGFDYTALRYFNVAGADPKGRTGQSTPGATHLIKVASETALGKRPFMQIFGKDYPTPDGTCIRDYIHVSDLVAAHRLALKRLRAGGGSMVANCGYGHGYSVLEVMASVKRVYGGEIDVRIGDRRPGDAVAIVANADRARGEFGWTPQHDDLDRIVSDALTWERILATKNWPSGS
jgi:UDP-glucose 4-epimerase